MLAAVFSLLRSECVVCPEEQQPPQVDGLEKVELTVLQSSWHKVNIDCSTAGGSPPEDFQQPVEVNHLADGCAGLAGLPGPQQQPQSSSKGIKSCPREKSHCPAREDGTS